jgi:hypothetical protein
LGRLSSTRFECFAQTLNDAGNALSVSFVMTSNTSDGNLIPYEMENIQALQREADERFGPGAGAFIFILARALNGWIVGQ